MHTFRGLALAACVLTFCCAIHLGQADAREGLSGKRQIQVRTAFRSSAPKVEYYVDFRARTASSYGHAFTWYGRTDQKEVEVAGLHPASDSVIPYIIGHVFPVPSETGASYGDLDDEYLTASFRVMMDEAKLSGSLPTLSTCRTRHLCGMRPHTIASHLFKTLHATWASGCRVITCSTPKTGSMNLVL